MLRNLCGKTGMGMNQTIFVTLYAVVIVGGVLLLLVTPWGVADDWSAIAAWVSIAVNMLGLLFIWLQLRSNRGALAASVQSAEAASAAAKTALLDSRAWVKADIVLGRANQTPDGQWTITLQVTLTNVGKTPALHVAYRAAQINSMFIRRDVSALTAEGANVGVTLFPGDISASERIVAIEWKNPTQLIGANVRYRLPSGDICETPAIYILLIEHNTLQLRLGLQEDLSPT